jgi:hypothetical protein
MAVAASAGASRPNGPVAAPAAISPKVRPRLCLSIIVISLAEPLPSRPWLIEAPFGGRANPFEAGC